MLNQAIEEATLAEKKAIMFHKSCLDSDRLYDADDDSTIFLRNLLKRIGGFRLKKEDDVPTGWSFEDVLSQSFSENGTALFKMKVEVDSRNTSRYGLVLSPETTPVLVHMGNAFNLFDDEPFWADLKAAYKKYMLILVKKIALKEDAKNIREVYLDQLIDFELELAKISPDPEDMTDGINNHTETTENKYSVSISKLSTLSPAIKWADFFKALGKAYNVHSLKDQTGMLVSFKGSTYFSQLSKLLNDTFYGKNKLGGKRTIHNYIVFKMISSYLRSLSCGYSSSFAQIQQVALGGTSSVTPCGHQSLTTTDCLLQTKAGFPQLLARRFVKTYYTDDYLGAVQNITSAVTKEFNNQFQGLDWMDNVTRANAIDKLSKMRISVGYPQDLFSNMYDQLYESIEIADNHLNNYANLADFKKANNLRSLDKPTERTNCIWNNPKTGDPTEDKAFYAAVCNALSVMPGLDVARNFRPDYPPAYNWGKAAFPISHEIAHGFDGIGRNYNGFGLYSNWWTKQTSDNYNNRISCLTKQFDDYLAGEQPLSYENKVLTENVADNAAVKISYQAFRNYFGRRFMRHLHLPGLPFTNEQVFFVALTQQFCYAFDTDSSSILLNAEQASPVYRVNGMMQNFEPWAYAFLCPGGSPMNPADRERCDLW